MHELNSTRRCIEVCSTAAEAERARLQLLDLGVRLAWADSEKCELADGYGVWVQECDARGAYARLNASTNLDGSM